MQGKPLGAKRLMYKALLGHVWRVGVHSTRKETTSISSQMP